MLGAPLGIALYAVLGFFNGIGRPTITLRVTLERGAIERVAQSDVHLRMGLGVAGSAWATGAAQLAGFAWRSPGSWACTPAVAFALISPADSRRARSCASSVWVSHGTLAGRRYSRVRAVSAHAGAPRERRRRLDADRADVDLVLLHAGRGHRHGGNHARRTGDRREEAGLGTHCGQRHHPDLGTLHGCSSASVVAAGGRWFIPWFTNAADPQAAEVAAKGCKLLWIAAGYQLFDGLNISSGACLRGAGDVRLPSPWCSPCPGRCSCRSPTCSVVQAGAGWVDWLPQYRIRRGRRLACRAHLHRLSRHDAVPALALGRLAPRGAAMRRARRPSWPCSCRFGTLSQAPHPAPQNAPEPVATAMTRGRIAPGSVSFVVLDVESGGSPRA